MAQQLSTNTFGTAKWIVSSDATQGTHTTIASALTSASSGDTIFIRPGTYTENLTLKAGVDLSSFQGEGSTPNVTIIGNNTFTTAGTVTISGIRLQTNSANCVTVSGSAASILNLVGCYLNCSNNTGISFSSSSSSAAINLYECTGNLGTTGIAFFASSSAGNISFYFCQFTNTGGSTTANTASSGTVLLRYCYFPSPITTSSTAIIGLLSTSIETTNTTALTSGGSSGSASHCYFSSGTATALVVNTNQFGIGESTVVSSNASAVGGTGTLNNSGISIGGTSSVVNPSTLNGSNLIIGGISFNGGTTILSNYTTGTYTPTYIGGSTAGTTTYGSQNGRYIRIGNLVQIQGSVSGSAATGTGSVTMGGLPFTIANTSTSPYGSLLDASANTWVASTTSICVQGSSNSTNTNIYCSGSGTGGGNLQIANHSFNVQYTLTYQV